MAFIFHPTFSKSPGKSPGPPPPLPPTLIDVYLRRPRITYLYVLGTCILSYLILGTY